MSTTLSVAGRSRLKREYMRLQEDPPPGIFFCSPHNAHKTVHKNDNNSCGMQLLTRFVCEIEGPRESPFEEIRFQIQVDIPSRYPMEPPSCQFVGGMIPYHPNIDHQGRICLDTLKRPPAGSWSPAVSLPSLLLSLQLLLGEPNADDALLPDVGRLFRYSRQDWAKEARRRIKKSLVEQTKTSEQKDHAAKRPVEARSEPSKSSSKSLKRPKLDT